MYGAEKGTGIYSEKRVRNMTRIVCYGDSNTYGWDPRFFSGDRYDHPWPEQLADMTGYSVANCGEPGRERKLTCYFPQSFQQEVCKPHGSFYCAEWVFR